MNEETKQSKKILRQHLKKVINSLDQKEIADRSQIVCDLLVKTQEFKQSDIVMIFLPLLREVDVTLIALRSWQEGKIVCVPLVSWEHKHMIPVQIQSLDDPMKQDQFGLKQPTNGLPVPIEDVDMVVVPGLGFDRVGRRIGRGGGFYDRFLSQPKFRGITCGVGFIDQVVDEVPVSASDVWLDMLATDTETLKFQHSNHK